MVVVGEYLCVCFVFDDGVEIMYYVWIWVWFGDGIDDVEGIVYVGDLVVYCFIECVFECG